LSSSTRIYLSGRLAEPAYLQARREGLGLSAWINKLVEAELVRLGEEARRAGRDTGAPRESWNPRPSGRGAAEGS